MLKIKQFTFNMFGINTYIVWNPETGEAAVIDPGMINGKEQAEIDRFISDNGLVVNNLINTHMHVDHIFGDLYIKEKYGVDITASPDDSFLGERAAMQCRMFGLPDDMAEIRIDRELKDGDTLVIGGEPVSILSVPGHSPGSLVLYSPKSRWAITGDVLFRRSIGRTDLVAGNHAQLIEGISKKLFTLPDDTVVYPGHGEPTTIGEEKKENPFVRS